MCLERCERVRVQVEEAELAAAVQTRRASHAEAEAAQLKAQLAESAQQLKDLSWQFNMAFGGASGAVAAAAIANAKAGGAGGGAAAGGAPGARAGPPGGFLDILGCGANFKR